MSWRKEIYKWIVFIVIFCVLLLASFPEMKAYKIIPKTIDKEAKIALEAYPELDDVTIKFIIKPSLSKSFMKAQPNFWSLFRIFHKRKYHIYLSETFKLDEFELKLADIPNDVLIGWLTHELGHIMDYETKTTPKLIYFGLHYYFSEGFIKQAEREADLYAIKHGMVDYILATKKFILNNANLSENYKNHIRKNYLSPDEIIQIVKEYENDNQEKPEVI